jgi:hypothetical protein
VTLRAVRVRSILLSALAGAVLLGGLPATPAPAAPGAGAPTVDPEGGTKSLRDQLDEAARGFNDATARLDASKARQAQLAEQMRGSETQLNDLTNQVGALAATAYKGGRVGSLAALLDSSSPDGLLSRATALETRARSDDQRLRQLKEAKAAQAAQQAALDAEVKAQQDQLAEMDKRKKAAEQALASVGGGAKTAGFTGGAATTPAKPAPRKPDGTRGPESCSEKDPTTSGCLTPRTLNALQQTKAAGFTRFVSCYRPQEDGGEHPRGRACDFAAQTNGFGGIAVGGDKQYGDRLAAWFIANANNLGVLYVIWFNQIWLPSTGWRAYRNGNGTPSGDHTNHVHLSVQ